MGVANRRPSSDSELIARMEMRLLTCVTRGPSREPYQTVSTVYFILGILRTDLYTTVGKHGRIVCECINRGEECRFFSPVIPESWLAKHSPGYFESLFCEKEPMR